MPIFLKAAIISGLFKNPTIYSASLPARISVLVVKIIPKFSFPLKT